MTRAAALLVAGAGAFVPGAAAIATLPPTPPPGESGVDIVREQAEQAATEYFSTVTDGGATNVVCELPAEDAAGVQFLCYGLSAARVPLVAQATINDHGTPEIAASGSGPAPTTGPTTTASPILGAFSGSGGQIVSVDPINGPTIVAVSHEGAGAFAVQPQQGGVPAGEPFAVVTGAWTGRYLVGRGGTITAFAITADGAWTLTVERSTSALAFGTAPEVTGENPDVVRYDSLEPLPITVGYGGPGPIVIAAVTVAGTEVLVDEPGGFDGEVTVPRGPGFLTVDAPGTWTLTSLAAAATTSAATTTTTTAAIATTAATTTSTTTAP